MITIRKLPMNAFRICEKFLEKREQILTEREELFRRQRRLAQRSVRPRKALIFKDRIVLL